VRAEPCSGPNQVFLASEVSDLLRKTFGTDALEFEQRSLQSFVLTQIGSANVAGEMPMVGKTSFRIEVVQILVSGNPGPGRELSFCLGAAAMNAIAAYLAAYEEEAGAAG
jgi:hypothetical protein